MLKVGLTESSGSVELRS